jgi:hypothetical protein
MELLSACRPLLLLLLQQAPLAAWLAPAGAAFERVVAVDRSVTLVNFVVDARLGFCSTLWWGQSERAVGVVAALIGCQVCNSSSLVISDKQGI